MRRKCKRKTLFFPTLTERDMPKSPSRCYRYWLPCHVRARDSSTRRSGYCSGPVWLFKGEPLRNSLLVKSMEISFFALPSKQGPVQGRFKSTHRLISLSTKVPACVRRFETPTPLNHERPALALSFRSVVWIREYLTSQFSLLMPYEPGLGQGQSQKKTSPCSA